MVGAPRPPRWPLLVLLTVLALCAARPAPSGFEAEAPPRAPRPQLSKPPLAPQGQISRALRRYQAFVSGAAKVSRWIHVGSGFFVIVSTPVSLISSGLGLRPAEMALCAYLGMFGAMLAGCELPLARGLFETYFRFLYTTQGRMLFMIFLAVVAWSCKYVGVLTKALLAFNALLSAYVYNSKALHNFGTEDSRVQGEVGDAVNRLKEGFGEVQSIGRMFGLSKMLGSSPKRTGPPPPPSAYDEGGYGPPISGRGAYAGSKGGVEEEDVWGGN